MSTWSWSGFLRGIDLSQRVFRLLDIPPKWIIIESHEVRRGSQQKWNATGCVQQSRWSAVQHVIAAPSSCCLTNPFLDQRLKGYEDIKKAGCVLIHLAVHVIFECKQNRGR